MYRKNGIVSGDGLLCTMVKHHQTTEASYATPRKWGSKTGSRNFGRSTMGVAYNHTMEVRNITKFLMTFSRAITARKTNILHLKDRPLLKGVSELGKSIIFRGRAVNFVQSYFLIIWGFLDPKQSNCHTFSKWPWIIEEELLTGPEGSCRGLAFFGAWRSATFLQRLGKHWFNG